MIISRKHRFIFVHIPKTAGQSIGSALSKAIPDIEYIYEAHSPIAVLPGHHDYQTFAFVRNPWERVLSAYTFYVRRIRQPSPEGFVEFISRPPEGAEWLLRQQVDYISGDRHVNVGRFERLEEDFKAMCNQVGLGELHLPHVNVSTVRPVEDFYDACTSALVARIFAKDIESLKYTAPKQKDV